MKMIHMSDLHLSADGSLVWGENSRMKFLSAIGQISRMKDIDAILVSGDISDDGSPASYIYADQIFKSINIPTCWCPGNHDNLEVLLNDFDPIFCQVGGQLDIDGWKLYFLNSVVPDTEISGTNRSRGIISVNARNKLDKSLYINIEPSIIILHHPPLEIGGWQDNKILKDRNSFREMLENHENVKLVLSGHVHYFTNKNKNGIIYSTATGLGFAFNSNLPRFELLHGHEGFSLISIEGDEIVINDILLKTGR